ncbi:MAG TPA: alpha/beta hydrolase [Casimicrobiaceae bacterium]|nr:alpha/beta hydrolase [Casimicrobiaceae bacterium]
MTEPRLAPIESPRYTAEFVECGYNNRAAVPDHPHWFATFARRSREANEAFAPTLDLRYGSGPKETLDLFVPATACRGTFVFIHGGYWRALDKADHLFVAPPFVNEGYAVAVPNYDLCPDVSIATIVEQCRRAIGWVVREGAKHGANPSPIVVGGHSAGGHLAAMMLATPAEAFGGTRHPVSAALSLSGVHDLRPLTLFSFNADLKLTDDEAARMSPALQPPQTGARVLVGVGANETSEFRRQSRLMWEAWPDNRPPNSSGPIFVPDRHHFDVVVDLADATRALTRATLALF